MKQRHVQVSLAIQQRCFRADLYLIRGFGRGGHRRRFCRQIDERARAIAGIKSQELGRLINAASRVSSQGPASHDFAISDSGLKTLVAPLDEIVTNSQAQFELFAQIDLILPVKRGLVAADSAIEDWPGRDHHSARFPDCSD